MKLLFLTVITMVLLTSSICNKEKTSTSGGCYKGRLEIKGMCSNYTIKLIEGNLDTSKIVASWKDETTQKTYTNVFALGSPCTFPGTINEGQEFYFLLEEEPQNCAVCLAYYPTPPKSLKIKVIQNCN